jgi:heme-degrading monooxygenase HmoA
MVHVLVRHKVADYSRWRAVFDDALMMRRNAGEQSYRVFRSYENANEVSLLCDFDTLEHARAFLTSDSLKEAMQAGGVVEPPSVQYLQEAVVIRRSAAD